MLRARKKLIWRIFNVSTNFVESLPPPLAMMRFVPFCITRLPLGSLDPNMSTLRIVPSSFFTNFLSPQEVHQILNAAQNLKHKAILSTVYSAGLRVSEVAHLQLQDIHSSNMRIFIRQPKGRKDRYTLLSENNLLLLRQYWKVYRPEHWLFPGIPNTKPISVRTVHEIFNQSRIAAGISKKASIHTLRHCFATHLLNQGADILRIKELLGHADIQSTTVYLHLSDVQVLGVKSPLDVPLKGMIMIKLQQVFSRFSATFLDTHPVHREGLNAARDIMNCRTAALGGHVHQCDSCDDVRISYNSCRNRNCPKCGNLKKEQWIVDRTSELLPVPYFHTVFTVPHELNPLFLANPKIMCSLLFTAASQTLSKLALDP